MPKKGKKSKKGGKGKNEAAEPGKPVELNLADHPELAPDYDPLAALYADPVEYERVHSFELENDTMKMIARELRLRLEKHTQSLTQIISHLNLEITKKDFKINELSTLTNDLSVAQDKLKKACSKETEQVSAEYESQIEHINKKLAELRQENEAMHEIKEEKEEAEGTFQRITSELEALKKEHAKEVSALERRNVMSKEHLKQEMLQKIKETKMMLLAMTEDQLHTTTKRTIIENDQMTAELMLQSRETERLLKQNNKLTKENRSLKRQVELNDQARDMLIRRSDKLQDIILSLNEQLAKRHKKHAVVKRTDNIDNDLEESERIVQSLETRIQDLDSMLRRTDDDIAVLRAQLADSREANNRMLGTQDEALTFTLMVFESMKEKLREAIKIGDLQREGGGTVLPAINPSGGVTGGPITYDSVHSKLQMVAAGDSSKVEQQQEDDDSDRVFKLTDLVTISQREAYLDFLIKKFNQYSPAQLKLITQHAM